MMIGYENLKYFPIFIQKDYTYKSKKLTKKKSSQSDWKKGIEQAET